MNTNTPADDSPTDGTPSADDHRARDGAGHATGYAAPTGHQLYDPLPYGAGFVGPEPLGFGVAPAATQTSAVEVAERRRGGSPVLAVAGLASLAVAVWAVLGAPVITPTVLLAAGLVITVLVGLMMVVRR